MWISYYKKIFELLQVLPTQCYPVNYDEDLFIRYPFHIKTDEWHTTQTLNTLASFSLYLKPDSLTYDKNTIFTNSAPKLIFNTPNNDLIDLLNKDNPNIVVTNIYVSPLVQRASPHVLIVEVDIDGQTVLTKKKNRPISTVD